LIIIGEKLTLKKEERLKSRKVIQQLFKEGKSFSVFPFRVIYLVDQNLIYSLQAGFSVSARNFKKAVDRNRIKRLMRESYRLQKNILQIEADKNPQKLAIFFIYTGKELPQYPMVFEKIRNAILKLRKTIEP
jgi:ribonuclease P protein component